MERLSGLVDQLKILRKGKNSVDRAADLRYIDMKICEIEEDVEVWSYTIMGNRQAWCFWDDFFSILLSHLTSQEDVAYPVKLSDEIIRILIDRGYDQLLSFASRSNSHLAFQVLGVLLMQYGARMTEEMRGLILSNSKWENESYQLQIFEDNLERKKYLLDFREKVFSYKPPNKVKVPLERFTDVFNTRKRSARIAFVDKRPIDFKIAK